MADSIIAPLARVFYRRQLLQDAGARVQTRFELAVLDKYIEAGYQVKRTDTVGRVKAPSWAIDFGIGASGTAIHASTGDLLRLPESEREHWAKHVAQTDLSENYLKMMMHPGSCIDDGELRDWGE